MAAYDAIVLGVGGVGSAALYHLARRGLRVLGIDRFAPPHDRGSSHGETRIIRQAYFEHPDYVPLLRETYRMWRELEAATATQLYCETGLIEVGPEDGVVVPGVLRAAEQHLLAVDQLTIDEIHVRWPMLRAAEQLVGVFEQNAGYLRVERCVTAHLDAAKRAGAELLMRTEVANWSSNGDLRVQTVAGEFTADRLVITAGPWAGELLASLDLQLEVRRKSMFWFDAPTEATSLPCFLFELPVGIFYGFPPVDGKMMKIAEHSGGNPIADLRNRNIVADKHEQAAIVEFANRHIPTLDTKHGMHSPCVYTMSPDEHFIVDVHPDDPRIVFAAGLSGHGFKFAPVLGKALENLAIDGATELPIEFLGLDRFAV